MPPLLDTLTLHLDYCHEHYARHAVDASGRCYGPDLKAVERLGYSWPRHVGHQWFKFTRRKVEPVQLDWVMAEEAKREAADLDPIDF